MNSVDTRQTTKFKRKKIIVKKKLQYRFVFLVMVSFIAGAGLTWADLAIAFRRIQASSPALTNKLMDEFLPYAPTMGFKMLIYVSIIFVVALVFSHKIGGPLYKIEKSAYRVGKGDLSYDVFYRKGDMLNSLRRSFNEMIRALKVIITDDRKKAADIATELSELALQTQDKNLAAKLNEISDKASTITKGFKL